MSDNTTFTGAFDLAEPAELIASHLKTPASVNKADGIKRRAVPSGHID